MNATLCYERENKNMKIVQQDTLANLELKSTIYDQVINAQKENVSNSYVKKKMKTIHVLQI